MKKFSKGCTRIEFLPLRAAELQLLQACAQGAVATISADKPPQALPSNTLRADFIRFLILGGDDTAPVHARGVRLVGAWIQSALDLTGCANAAGFTLQRCQFESSLLCEDAKIAGTVSLSGSAIPGVTLDGAVIVGDVFLNDGFKAVGEVRMLGAQIGGSLSCIGATLNNATGDALSLDRAVIKGSVLLKGSFTSKGAVRLLGAQIGGDLSCVGGTLCAGTTNANGECRDALMADSAVIKGSVLLRDGFVASGKVRLPGAHISGNLDCCNSKFDGAGSHALNMDSASIEGNLYLRDGFTATGEVFLLGAKIGGSLECSNAKFDGKGAYALSADGAEVNGDVYLRAGFTAEGTVRLLGVRIAGKLECTNALFDCKSDYAIIGDSMQVKGAFTFKNLVQPANRVSLASASVGSLEDDEPSWGTELVLDGFVYQHITGGAPTDAATRLAWLDKQRADHTGMSGPNLYPQPWQQLQKVLRAMGHAEDARQVAIAFEERMHHAGLIGRTPADWSAFKKAFYTLTVRRMHSLFGMLIGYGHRPIRLCLWMVVTWLFCGAIYWAAALNGVMGPSNPLVFQNAKYESCQPNWYLCATLPEEFTGFSPLIYSLDVLLPLVNLQQEADWAPLIPTPDSVWYKELFANWTLKHFIRIVLWFEILFGWMASLLLVAVVSGLTKRNDE